MGDPPWRLHRRPHSAGGVAMATLPRSRPGSVEGRPPSMSESVSCEQAVSPELDFTDKLKALRELIASSKSHRHAREAPEKSPSRIVARRSHNICDAKEVGEKVQFTVNSMERRELADRLGRARTDKDIIASKTAFVFKDGILHDYELDLTSDGLKYAPQRPHSAAESYSHLLSRDLKQMSQALERGWMGSHNDLSPDSSPKHVTLRRDDLSDGRRTRSSLDYFHHEVPERDWNVPSRTHQGHGTLSQDVPAALLASDLKGRELIKEKEAIYKQYSPRDSHASTSPPEHDCPSSGNTPRPIQTNVQLSDKPSRVKVRPHSADPVKRPSLKVKHSACDEEERGHWTQLLSQKWDKNDSRSVPSSPATVQSNVSLDSGQHASHHTFLLQEAARQLEQEKQCVKTKKHRDSHLASTVENGETIDVVEEASQDDEVAKILQHPRTKKKIIIKRGSVKFARESDSNSQQISHKKTSTQHSSTDCKPPHHTRSKSALQAQSSVESDDNSVPEIGKDDHILTLDKLKTLLRGRRSESRPNSQTSSASVSSPAPMKAFHHHNKHHYTLIQSSNGEGHASSENVAVGKSNNSDSNTSKPAQRKVIKRPPSVPRPKEDGQKSSSSSQKLLKIGWSTEDSKASVGGGRVKSVGETNKEKTTAQRPSSAPHLSSKMSSSSLSSAKSLSSATRKGDRNVSTSTKDGKMNHVRERSRSSSDFTKMNGEKSADSASTTITAQSLRSNVHRLHQEVNMRVNQEAYIVQGLMSDAEHLDGDLPSPQNHDPVKESDSEQIRRRLSFDEDAPNMQKREVGAEKRSRSCIPFGKRLGMVDTGSVSRNGLDFAELSHKRKPPPSVKTGSGHRKGQTETETEHSFLSSIEQMSNNQATSTPKRSDLFQKANCAQLSAIIRDRQSMVVKKGHVDDDHMVPEKETISNLRKRRPASVGAIPFQSSSQPRTQGAMSGSDAADLIMSQLGNASMVHLLQQLYTADDATRQAIIVKVQYFKKWQTTAQCLKHQRQLYAESLKRAHKFLVSRLQRRCFLYWRVAADENRKNRMADSIHRRHMLRKGLQGFSWAIMKSKHQTRTLRMKVSAIVIRAAFTKWHTHFESRREERLRTAFRRWREYAYEEKIVREKQRDQNEKLVCLTMLLWREAYDRRIKENIADNYLRSTALRQSWRAWQHYTNSSKEKARRHSLALNLRKRNMQRNTMHVWRVALFQSRKASQHFRTRRIHRTLQAWRQGAQISRVERQRDMATSLEHWRYTTTRHTFIRWYQQLHQCRAVAMANKTLSRKTFDFWRQVWQTNMHRRQEVEAAITRSRLRKSLMTWRRNVVDRRRKQKQAVYLLETCLMRVTLLDWSRYTAYKAGFRASLQSHVKVIQCTTLSRCFWLWRDALHVRLDERRKRQLWSLACVRKMTAHWRHKCHIQRLHVTLEETEPIRELGLLRRMFGQWLAAKSRADEENGEVVASRHILQRCAVQRHFQDWRLATQRMLTIRPLVLRHQRQLVTWCFDAWHQYIRSRLERHRREKLFQKNQLSRAFARWKRQYHCQQVSRLAQRDMMQRLALCLLHEWRDILHRKHQARLYHCRNLLRHTFFLWQRRTHRQLREKAEEHAEQELSQELKQRCFNQWWSGVQAQIAGDYDAIARLQQRHHHNHIRSSFLAWRRSLHAHLISRAYQRSITQRLLRSVLLEWQEATSQSLCSAVQHFAQQLGLQQDTARAAAIEEGEGELVHSLEFSDLMNFGDMDQFASPCSSSAASLKQLFASDHSTTSERMFGGDLDLDRASLLTSGLLETMEERRQKNLRMQGLSMMFVTRLRHWPVSLAFSQWQEYTLRQRHLRQLAQEVEEKHRALMVHMAFRQWTIHHANNQKATNLRNWKLQHGSLMTLLEYGRHRKVKAMLAQRARGHLVKHVLGKIFPWWLAKAQEQRHQRTILHLWTTATPEEAELLPLEASLSRQIRQRSLRWCLQVWRVRFVFLMKLKRVYHAQLLARVLNTWQGWACLRQQQQRKGESFLQARRKSLAFRMWCERLHQKRETERRYQAALEGYQRLVFRCWREWAHVSKQHRRSRQVLEVQVNQLCVKTHFVTWRRLAQHAHTIRAARHTHLMTSVLRGWRQATQEGKQLRQTILSFQAMSLARLVGQLFHRWQLRYHQQQRLHMQREEQAQQSALHCGRCWRRKAQNTRGRRLIVVFKYSRLSRMFDHWRASLVRVEELKQRQATFRVQKNREVMGHFLAEWRQRLQSTLLMRTFTRRLLVTVLNAWQVFAKASKERRIRGLALQHALQERNLRVYFLYWRQMSVRVRSLQNNVEVRLQLRVLQAWSYIVRRRCSQRRLGEKFVRLRQDRMLASAFHTLRSRYDYCLGLKEMADSMCGRRDKRIAVSAMQTWKDAVDRVVADRFYHRLVCVRTARTWLTFVMRVKAERQHEQEQTYKAVAHRNKTLCRVVLDSLKQEVKVKQQLQRRRHRIAVKFATGWKHITDLSVTALIMEEERLYARYWRCWRLAWARRQAANREAALHRRQLLSQVFTSWCSLCPSRAHPNPQTAAPSRRTARVMSSESDRDSPTTPRSFLPVPVTSSRRYTYDS